MPRRPRLARVTLITWALAVMVITLVPGDVYDDDEPFLCFPCGERGSPDALLNVVLFLPFGFALGSLGVGAVPALAMAATVSAGIEGAQSLLPGRYPTAADIVANGLGGGLGALGVAPLLQPLALPVVTIAAAAMVMSTVWLSPPDPPAGTLFAEFGTLGVRDRGADRVVAARVMGRTVADSTPTPDLRFRNHGTSEVAFVRFVVGDETRWWRTVLTLRTAEPHEALVLSRRGEDLLVRVRSRATTLRFRQPASIEAGMFDTVTRGDTLEARVWTANGELCVGSRVETRCGLGVRPSEGWWFLLGGSFLSPVVLALLSSIWLAIPLGLIVANRARPVHRVGSVVIVLVVAVAATRSPTVAGIDPLHLLGAALLGLVVAKALSLLADSVVEGSVKPRSGEHHDSGSPTGERVL